jgi:hypothetical protein
VTGGQFALVLEHRRALAADGYVELCSAGLRRRRPEWRNIDSAMVTPTELLATMLGASFECVR